MNGPGPTEREAGAEVLVVGIGVSGRAAARFLRKQGRTVAVSDRRPAAELKEILPELEELGISEIETGGHTSRFFVNRRLIVVSPGVPLDLEPLAAARARGVEIIGELELACRESRLPLVGVTGTNGKTTTVTLLGEILAADGRRVFVGGNLGRPAVEMTTGEYDLAVLELSSFQLESIAGFHPGIAVVLNLTPDHQDRYPDPAAYLAAKAAISRNQQREDFLLLNLDDPHLAAHGRALAARRAAGDLLPRIVWFSLEQEVAGGACWRAGRIVLNLPAAEGRLELAAPKLKLPGGHNRSNALAALLAARLQGVSDETILKVLAGFSGVPHRLEYLGEVDGVACYNDSKATNLDAVVKAVESFDRPLVLLLGGHDKGADFAVLAPLLARRDCRVIAFGAAGKKIAGQLPGLVSGDPARNLLEAWQRARAAARSGEVILLAPGCASFDEFSSYRERGEAFRRLVAAAGAVADG
jgi:UDP-N-acetylmuramoylalanine--D-glutamate ligase